MFKHILIPTDGSDLSAVAIENGVKFAKEINARITGLTVTAPFYNYAMDAMQISSTQEQYDIDAKTLATRNLSGLQKAALDAGVQCELVHGINEQPYEEIVEVAAKKGCDVIFQASHGRSGAKALLMGSVTNKVLAHCKIPVLVFR